MTDHEDRFAVSLDAVSRGEPPAADDGMARFVAEARSTWANPADDLPGTPPRLSAADRRRLWSAIQEEAAVGSSATYEGSDVMSATSPSVRAPVRPPSGWGASVARWQPVLSMAVMFAILAGLVGIAYTGLNRQANGPEVANLPALSVESTPSSGVQCTPYGPEELTREEIKTIRWSDWPTREYIPVAPVDHEVGQAIVNVYENWFACGLKWSNDDEALLAAEQGWNFNSERKQYQMYFSNYPEQRPEEIEAMNRFNPDWVIQSGTLPLNRPERVVTEPVTGLSFDTFAPGDVYQLSDGRYGVVLGRISTIMLAASQPESGLIPDADHRSTWLTFIAFEEVDGFYLVDEYNSFCVVPFAALQGDSEISDDLCDA